MSLRKAAVQRKTTETDITLELVLDSEGAMRGSSGIGFLDHMLVLFAKHGGFNLSLEAYGDSDVDDHHTVEDIGLCLGQAFSQALAGKEGLRRYASLALPMDETLVLCAVDISGRPGLYYDVAFQSEKIGQFDSELVEVFWKAMAGAAAITIHLRRLAGSNSHHTAEAIFKGMGRVLQEAARIEGKGFPSSKGVL